MRLWTRTRKVLALLFTTAALPLAGCGNGTTTVVEDGGEAIHAGPAEVAPPVAAPEGETVELTFRWWGGEDRQQRTLNAIALFEDLHPNIRILPQPVSFDGYYDQLMIEFVAGTQPDIFQMDIGRPREFGPQGLLYPLNDIVNLTVSDSILEESSWDGEIFGAAATANAPSMLLNPRLFEEAGVEMPTDHIWTWDEFNTIVEELVAGLPEGTFAAEFAPVNLLPAWVTQRNGVGTADADTGEVVLTPELLSEYLDFYAHLEAIGAIPPAAQAVETFTVGPEESLAGRGLAAITFVPSSSVTAFSSASGDDLVLARVPGDDSEAYVGTLVNIGIYWAISANCAHPVEAGQFIDFMINDPGAGEYLGVERGVPLNTTVAAAIAPGLNEVSQQQVEYMASVINSGAPTNRGVPGAGQTPAFTNRAVESVLFGQTDSLSAAQQWVDELQNAIDAAR